LPAPQQTHPRTATTLHRNRAIHRRPAAGQLDNQSQAVSSQRAAAIPLLPTHYQCGPETLARSLKVPTLHTTTELFIVRKLPLTSCQSCTPVP
jgi:hypothetical protein